MQVRFILNAAPYGTELIHNGLRLAAALARREHHAVRVRALQDKELIEGTHRGTLE